MMHPFAFQPSGIRRLVPILCVLMVATALISRRPFAHADASTAATATLTVKVTGLRNHKGDLIFGVFKAADGFPTEKNKSVNWQVKPADADSVEFTAKLPPGRYSASVLHDENRNGKMDFNVLGVPLEGYGVTNNPKPKMRKAKFDEARFDLPTQGAALTISIQYF
jgi:uncharacterized protein (DUF2141 family)